MEYTACCTKCCSSIRSITPEYSHGEVCRELLCTTWNEPFTQIHSALPGPDHIAVTDDVFDIKRTAASTNSIGELVFDLGLID